MIRPPTTNDATQLCDIYNHYVFGTSGTFEEQRVTFEDMAPESCCV